MRYSENGRRNAAVSWLPVGVLSETFINAFGVFEETKDELRELIGERKKYFSFLQDLFFRNRRDRIIGEIVDRF